ncbi:MAG: GAF domain-containing protein [Aggregatilineales bacterium]
MFALSPTTRQRLARWFPLTAYSDPLIRYRAFCTYVLGMVVLAAAFPINLALAINSLTGPNPDLSGLSLLIVNPIVVGGGAITAIALTRAGRQVVGAAMLLVMIALTIGIGLASLTPPIDLSAVIIVLALWMFLSIATLLIGTRGLPLIAIVTLLGAMFFVFQSTASSQLTGAPNNVGVFVVPIVSLMSLLLAHVGVNWLQARGQSEAVQRVNLDAADRSAVTASLLSITQRSLLRLPLPALLSEVTRLVRDSFAELDTVQVWLIDPDRRSATLSASTDKADTLQRHVGVGSLDVVGRVAIDGRAILVRNVAAEQSYRRNALPPGILTQLAVPLKIASEVIGVLVAFSAQSGALEGRDGEGMQQLADQIAVAVDNARLYEAAQTTQAETRRLTDEMRANQRTVERLNQQLTGQVWGEYLRGRSQPLAFTLDLQSGQVDNFADWTDTLAEAGRTNQAVTRPTAGTPTLGASQTAPVVIALPITVHGQAVGAVEFELEPGQLPTVEQIAVIQQAVERMALSADNTRLLEEAQRLARREALIGLIGTRLQSAASVDSVLSAAAQNLAEVLNAPRVAIRITGSFGNDGEPIYGEGAAR